jgi:16S rRNA processing protein RimM
MFNGKEILMPVIDEVILDVNREAKLMKIKAPQGLIDLYIE